MSAQQRGLLLPGCCVQPEGTYVIFLYPANTQLHKIQKLLVIFTYLSLWHSSSFPLGNQRYWTLPCINKTRELQHLTGVYEVHLRFSPWHDSGCNPLAPSAPVQPLSLLYTISGYNPPQTHTTLGWGNACARTHTRLCIWTQKRSENSKSWGFLPVTSCLISTLWCVFINIMPFFFYLPPNESEVRHLHLYMHIVLSNSNTWKYLAALVPIIHIACSQIHAIKYLGTFGSTLLISWA